MSVVPAVCFMCDASEENQEQHQEYVSSKSSDETNMDLRFIGAIMAAPVLSPLE